MGRDYLIVRLYHKHLEGKTTPADYEEGHERASYSSGYQEFEDLLTAIKVTQEMDTLAFKVDMKFGGP
jgi:hypothetical protein